MTYPPSPPQRRPPSKYLALWISLPVIALVACCGGIGTFLNKDDEADGTPQPVASIAGVSESPTPTRSPNTPPSEPAASATTATTTSPPPTARSTTTTTTRPAAPPTTRTTTPPSSVYYKNCDAVRAAGAAPLYRGQPGYRPGLDGDGDGVACEKK